MINTSSFKSINSENSLLVLYIKRLVMPPIECSIQCHVLGKEKEEKKKKEKEEEDHRYAIV